MIMGIKFVFFYVFYILGYLEDKMNDWEIYIVI